MGMFVFVGVSPLVQIIGRVDSDVYLNLLECYFKQEDVEVKKQPEQTLDLNPIVNI